MVQDFLNEHLDEMTQHLCDLVRIPSIFDEQSATETAPFGTEVQRGLEEVLKIGEKLGFKTRNVGGYAAEMTIGNGHRMIGILCHEDVVPAGDGWHTDPFEPVIEEDKIIGRGSSDDKGPLVSAMYAAYYLACNQLIPDDACIRIIVGANEEEEWRCVDYYKEHVDRLPDVSIVPDGYFPLVYCEKGLMDFDIHTTVLPNASALVQVLSLEGGSARNIVPGKANCLLHGTDEVLESVCQQLRAYANISCKKLENQQLEVVAVGKSTHAMDPDKGESAIAILLDALSNLEESISIQTFLNHWNAVIGTDCHGERLDCDVTDELSGRFTFNVGTIELRNNQIDMQANYRFPISMKFEETEQTIASKLQAVGFEYEPRAYMAPLYVNPNSDIIKMLMESYQSISGDYETKPLAIGGATYARAIPNAIAFGALFPWEEELAHEANEFISLTSFRKTTEIYIDALTRLMNHK